MSLLSHNVTLCEDDHCSISFSIPNRILTGGSSSSWWFALICCSVMTVALPVATLQPGGSSRSICWCSSALNFSLVESWSRTVACCSRWSPLFFVTHLWGDTTKKEGIAVEASWFFKWLDVSQLRNLLESPNNGHSMEWNITGPDWSLDTIFLCQMSIFIVSCFIVWMDVVRLSGDVLEKHVPLPTHNRRCCLRQGENVARDGRCGTLYGQCSFLGLVPRMPFSKVGAKPVSFWCTLLLSIFENTKTWVFVAILFSFAKIEQHTAI